MTPKRFTSFCILFAVLTVAFMFTVFAHKAIAEQVSLEVKDHRVASITLNGGKHMTAVTCLDCHKEHFPKGKKVTSQCLDCHKGRYESAHAEQSCTFCHKVLGETPDCLLCHLPHAQGQMIFDCLGCHSAHHPLKIRYPVFTPRAFCMPCHKEVDDQMKKIANKHQIFDCTYCHKGLHPNVPECQTCHGEPHSAVMHQKRPNCLDCHMDPHSPVK